MKKRLLPNGIIFMLALMTLLALPGQTSQGFASLSAHTGSQPAAVLADPADWPMYGHDYQRTNFNPSETIIGAGNVNQLVQRWQAVVSNRAGSYTTSAAPSVSNGVVYVGSNASSGNNFYAFNATSGTPIWQENIGYRNPGCFDVGIGSTPAISGTQVVVGADNASANPGYYGLNTADGSQVWVNPMNVGTSGFPWESPFLFRNRAYVGISSRCDNPSVRGELRAVDMTTGNTVASAFFVGSGEAGGGIWQSPALTPDGNIVAVGTGEDYICTDCSLTRSMVTMDANTLAILQHHQEPSPNNDLDFGTSSVIFHDSQNRTLVAAGHKNGTFYTYDITNVNNGAIWTHTAGGTTFGLMPAYDPTFGSGGTLFIVNSSLYAVDPANGNIRWTQPNIPGTHGNIAIANGLIFINGGASGLQIFNETDGSFIRTLPPNNPGAANSGVAVSHGFIYWLSGSYVNAWSLPATGTPSATDTALVATHTPTPTFTRTPTLPPNTSTPTSTNTALATAPASPTHTFTAGPTGTFTHTPTPGPSGTGTSTPTSTPTCTASPPPPTTTPPGTIPPCWLQNSRLLYEGFDYGTLDQFSSSVVLTDTGGWTPVPVAVTCYTDYAAFAPDPDSVSDQRLTLNYPLNIPSFATGSFLVFSHNYSFDQSGGTNNDGGVLELSTDNGITWFDGGPYITSGGYNGTLTRTGATCGGIPPPFSNGQSAWVGIGGGDVSVNIQQFIGQSLRFRFRLGSDCSVGSTGWYVDNISVSYNYLYNCTPTVIPTAVTPTATPTSCTLTFTDVPSGSTFYPFIRCLACKGIINGYPDGTFKPGNNVTRGQLSKIVSNSAGFDDNQTTQMFEDVPVGSTFFQYIGRLASRGFINGYPCGGPGEPCVPPANLPYFRPNNNATRGQISKIVSNAAGFNDPPTGQQFEDIGAGSTYYTYTYRLVTRGVMSGYPCGTVPAGHCVPPGNLPYFLPNNNATRGQTSKIDANTFFPECNPPGR